MISLMMRYERGSFGEGFVLNHRRGGDQKCLWYWKIQELGLLAPILMPIIIDL